MRWRSMKESAAALKPQPPIKYSSEQFIDGVDEEWICAICTDVPVAPPNLPCPHLFCLHELQQLATKECPTCRTPFSGDDLSRVNAAIRSAICRRTVKCRHHTAGCAWSGVIGHEQRNVIEHMAECKYESQPCRWKCGKRMEWKDRTQHEQHECSQRSVRCDQCGSLVSLAKLPLHQQPQRELSGAYPFICSGLLQCVLLVIIILRW